MARIAQTYAALAGLGLMLSCLPALSQGGPIPGGAPVPAAPAGSAPIPGIAPPPAPRTQPAGVPGQPQSAYSQLPLSAADAQARVEELKALVAETDPKSVQESVLQLCEWLTDMADAHNKLANAFSKHEQTKAQADGERQSARKFSQLKNQAQLLKAQLLMRQARYPEALGPLIEIVIAEPRSATGAAAYKHLKDMGFSEEVVVKEVVIKPEAIVAAPAAEVPAAPVTDGKGKPAIPAAPPVVKTQATSPPAAAPKTAPPAKSSHAPTVWLTGTPFGGHEKTGR